MNLRRCIVMMSLLFAPAALLASAVDKSAGGDTGTRFSVTDDTQVPGRTLAAGTYSIRVVDHLSDRMIVQVNQPGGKQTTFLALPKSALAKPASNGPLLIKSKSGTAMRGFAFPDGTVAEFVYPKAEAVTLAKANQTTIPAVDPASEGRVADPTLSPTDMKMVSLWMLTPTPVGPDASGPGVQAARYQQPEEASAKVPTAPRARTRPAVAVLPHTAGEMPLLGLVGFISACSAGWLMRRRQAVA